MENIIKGLWSPLTCDTQQLSYTYLGLDFSDPQLIWSPADSTRLETASAKSASKLEN